MALVELLARAICAGGYDPDAEACPTRADPARNIPYPNWQDYAPHARAVISSLRKSGLVIVPEKADDIIADAIHEAYVTAPRVNVCGMSVEAQWRAQNTKEIAAWRAATKVAPQSVDYLLAILEPSDGSPAPDPSDLVRTWREEADKIESDSNFLSAEPEITRALADQLEAALWCWSGKK